MIRQRAASRGDRISGGEARFPVEAPAAAAGPAASSANQGRGDRQRAPQPGFRYNARLWALGAPSMVVVLLLGGRTTSLVLSIGIMVGYCFDLANNKEGALLTLWATMLVTACFVLFTASFLLKGSLLAWFQLAVLAIYLSLVLLWATLQFRWMYGQEPLLAGLMERVLLSSWPLTSAMLVFWGGVAMVGAEYAALILLLSLYAAASLYGSGGASQQHLWGGNATVASSASASAAAAAAAKGAMMTPEAAGQLHAAMMILPASLQLVMYRKGLLSGFASTLLLELVLLIALPCICMWTLVPRGGLWWLSPRRRRVLEEDILVLLGPAAVCVALECCNSLYLMDWIRQGSGRSSSSSSSSLSWLLAWDRALLSLSVYFAVGGALAARRMSNNVGKVCFRVTAVLSARFLLIACGVESAARLLLPGGTQLIVDGVVLSLAIFCQSRQLIHYMVVVLGSGVALAAWGAGSGWQEEGHGFRVSTGEPLEVGPWSITPAFRVSDDSFVLLAAALCSISAALPGLLMLGTRAEVISVLLTLQAGGLALAEAFLHAEDSSPSPLQGPGGDALYPAYLMLLTGTAGLAILLRLWSEWRLEMYHLWMACCIHVGKALAAGVVSATAGRGSMAAAGDRHVQLTFGNTFLPILGLLLALSAPWLYGSEERGGSGTRASGLEGSMMLCWVATGLWFSSDALLRPLLQLVLGGGRDRGVNGAEITAAAGVVLSVFLLCLVGKHFPNNIRMRRIGTALLVTSLVVAVVQPELSSLPVFGGGEAAGGGVGGGTGAWGLGQWSGALAVSYALLALVGLAPAAATSVYHRIVVSAVFGGALGISVAASSLPGVFFASTGSHPAVALLSLPFFSMFALVAFLLLETFRPRPKTHLSTTLPTAYTVFMGLAGGSYCLLLMWGLRGGAGGARRGLRALFFAELSQLYLAVVAMLNFAIALGFKVASGVGRGAATRAGAAAAGGGAATAAAVAAGYGRPNSVSALDRERWMPVIGNVACVSCFAGVMSLVALRSHSELYHTLAIFPLSSLLLLLQNDRRFFANLKERNRHVPCLVVATLLLTASALYYVLLRDLTDPHPAPAKPSSIAGLVLRSHEVPVNAHLASVSVWSADGLFVPLLHLVLTVVTLPSHARYLGYLWTHASQRDGAVLWAMGVNVVPLVLADLVCVRLLGLLGLVGGLMQIHLSHQHKKRGMAGI